MTSISPTSGPAAGGTTVAITGANFTGIAGAAGVKFGVSNATSYTVNSDTQITAVAPAGTGTVDVTVTNGGNTSATSASSKYAYVAPPPVITTVSPNSAPTAGGATVIIGGSGFAGTTGAASVKFGVVNASSYSVSNDGMIIAVAPAGTGTVDVTVTNNGQTSAISPNDRLTYIAPPTVTVAVAPSPITQGGTTTATWTVSNPNGATLLDFSLSVVLPTNVTVAPSPNIVNGCLGTVTATSGGTTVNLSSFTVSPNNLCTFSVSLTASAPGNYSIPTGTPTAATTFSVPLSGTPGTPASLQVNPPVPTLTSVSPSVLPLAGGTVTLIGTNFYSPATVLLNGGNTTNLVVNSTTSITVTFPARPAGTAQIRLFTNGGGANPLDITYVDPPTVSSVSPNPGPTAGNASVTITGQNFTGATSVTIGGAAATNVVVTNPTTITAKTPAGAAGPASVLVTTPGGSNAANTLYTYSAPPVVTVITPSDAPTAGGTSVTIQGSGFTGTAGAAGVQFGGINATSYSVFNDGIINATVPAHALGTVDVTVTNNGQTSATSGSSKFNYFAPPTVAVAVAPSPITLGGATTATWTLSNQNNANLSNGVGLSVTLPANVTVAASPNAVNNCTTGSLTATSGGTTVSLSNGSLLSNRSCTISVSLTASSPGNYSIPTGIPTATTSGGTSLTGTAGASASLQVNAPAPTVSTVSPGSGPTTGNTGITITGQNFTGATSVTIGGTAASNVVVTNPTTITATTPAGAAGQASVVVTAPGGAGTGTNLYTYIGPPTTIAVSAGNNQSAAISTAFGTALQAIVRDNNNNPVPGVTVTFTAPNSGASGTFAGGGNTATAASNPSGVATAPAFTANGTANNYNVTASAPNVNTPASFALTNTTGPTSQISSTSGSGQSAIVNTAYANALTATVRDAGNNPVSGVTVTFTAPNAGASGTFAGGGLTATAPTNVSGIATAPAFTANSVTGNYAVTASAPNVNMAATFSLTNTATGPAITANPTSQTVSAGSTATFTAGASGAPTPTVQWQVSSNGGNSFSDIAGATNTTLSFAAQTTDNGNLYRAVFTNSAGSARTTAATLTVNSTPSVTTNPASQTVSAGSTATFTAAASGNPAPTVQWQVSSNGGGSYSNVASATSTTLTFTAQASDNSKLYRAVFTNAGGSATTTFATLTVISAPTVTSLSPASGPAAGGTSVTVSGTNLTGAIAVKFGAANAASFTVNSATSITVVSPAGSGTVDVTVTTPSGTSATSAADQFGYTTAPGVTTNPAAQSVSAGSNATFSSAASGNPAPTVQWQVSTNSGGSFANIQGATSTTFTFATQANDTGNQYRAVFTNSAGSATTSAATLTVNTAPGVTTNPVSQTVLASSNVSFTAAASGSPAPTVQWQVSANGSGTFTNITGATATTLTFGAQNTDNGNQYRAVFTNSVGSATTSAATLTVMPIQTTTTTVASSLNPSTAGQAVTFTASVTAGSGTPTGTVVFSDGGVSIGTAVLTGGLATFSTSALTIGSHAITASFGGAAAFAGSTSVALTQTVGAPLDSVRLRQLQVLVTPTVAQVSGQAITGAIDSAIGEGFNGGGTFVSPSGGGVRFNFAADPEAQGSPNITPRNSDPFSSVSGSLAATGRDPNSIATARFDDSFNALGYAGPRKAKAPSSTPEKDWLGWVEIRGAVLDRWSISATFGAPLASASMLYGNQVNMLAGLSRRLIPSFLIGVLGGYETFDYRSDSLAGRLKGDGWSVGAYAGWMISSNIRIDAALVYSSIGYDGTSGLASGNFTGKRLLASGGLVGTYAVAGLRIEPSARVYALWEHENAYTDTLGTLQGGRDFSAGRASSGVKVAYPINWTEAVTLSPYAGLYGDYYFNTDSIGPVGVVPGAIPTGRAFDGWSARALGGVAASFPNGAQINVGAERSGLGGNTLGLWVYRARGSVPFTAR